MENNQINSAGIVLYVVHFGIPSFLLLKNKFNSRDFSVAKGHIEKNEKIFETIKREVFEETNLSENDYIFDDEMEFKFCHEIIPTKRIPLGKKTVFLKVARIKKESIKKIKLSREHTKYVFANLLLSKKLIKLEQLKDTLNQINTQLLLRLKKN